MTTLKGIFPDLKPVRQKNFIHENVKNLHRMKKCLSTNIEEPQKLQIRSRKKNNNYTEDILSKVNTNLQVKQQESIHAKDAINHKLNQQQEFYKRSGGPVLKENAAFTKKNMHLTNNNISINQKKEGHKQSHKSVKKLHGKVLSDSNLSYTSTRDIDKNQIQVKSQGIQTLDTTEIDHLYSEGVIKYPSKQSFSQSVNKNKGNQEIDKSSSDVVSLTAEKEDAQSVENNLQDKSDSKNFKVFSPKEETDFIKLNRDHCSTSTKAVTPIKNSNSHNTCKYNNNNNNTPAANYRMGVVPKYIKDRKETLEKIQKAKTQELNANCPDGHVLLPDHERKETLRVLRKNYQDYVNELNMMPIKVDTLRAQRQKMEIEKQLNKLEEGIKVFSRPKVYVKMNE